MTNPDARSIVNPDAMYARVVHMMDATECARCRNRPNLLFAWDGVNKFTIIDEATVAARLFAEQAVAHLKATGWRMSGDEILCPNCQSEVKPTQNNIPPHFPGQTDGILPLP